MAMHEVDQGALVLASPLASCAVVALWAGLAMSSPFLITAGQKNLPLGLVRIMSAPHKLHRSFVQECQRICCDALWNNSFVHLFSHYPLPAPPSNGGLKGGVSYIHLPFHPAGLASNSGRCL